MSKSPQKLEVEFVLRGMRTTQFALLADKLPSQSNLEYDIQFDFKIDPKHQFILVLQGIVFRHGKKILCKLETESAFQISEKSWHTFKVKGGESYILPKNLLAHLAHIATGAARGILISKTENTELSSLILPLVNVVQIIQEDIKVPAEVQEIV